MRKVHNLIDKFGQWGKNYKEKKGVYKTRGRWAANTEKDIGNSIPMEVVLKHDIEYDEL